MHWEKVQGIFVLNFDAIFTAAIAAVVFIIGVRLRMKVNFFRQCCVPAGVIGGFIVALITFALYLPDIATVNFSNTLQIPMISVFFTRIGLTGSFRAFRSGGRVLMLYTVFCLALAFLQNFVGVVLAKSMGLHPILGIMAGAVSLEGGHNLAVVFGPMAEGMGVAGAQAVAVAAATFGLMAGGFLGAPTARWLVWYHGLTPETDFESIKKGYHDSEEKENIEIPDFIHTLGLMLVLMALGRWGADEFHHYARMHLGWYNFTMPGYLGAMFLAVIFRNVNDHFKIIKIHPRSLDLISTVSITLFLTTSMMNLKIWELYGLALPLLVILSVQVLMVLLLAISAVFNTMGRNYDAAIICSGFIGHGLGAPPSAVSMMRAVCDHFNVVSYKAFLIVPLCGAALIDIFLIPMIIWYMKVFAI